MYSQRNSHVEPIIPTTNFLLKCQRTAEREWATWEVINGLHLGVHVAVAMITEGRKPKNVKSQPIIVQIAGSFTSSYLLFLFLKEFGFVLVKRKSLYTYKVIPTKIPVYLLHSWVPFIGANQTKRGHRPCKPFKCQLRGEIKL